MATPRVADEKGPGGYEEIELNASVLRQYVGHYQFQPGAILTVEAREGQLYAELTGQSAHPMFPYAEDRFFFRVVNAQLEFERGDDGSVTGLVLYQDGGAQRAPRID